MTQYEVSTLKKGLQILELVKQASRHYIKRSDGGTELK